MQPKSPSILECPVGRAVETVGEWWSILTVSYTHLTLPTIYSV